MKKITLIILTVIIVLIIGGTILWYFNNKIIKDNIQDDNITTNDIEENKEEEKESKDLFGKYYSKAEEILNTMSLQEKVGQMFLVRFPENGYIEEIKNYFPGGYILFGRDFANETKDSIKQKLVSCQNSSKLKLILGVDEEGGTVSRVSAYKAFRSSRFESPQAVIQRGGTDALIADSHEKSALLKELGLNMNLSPVADIPTTDTSFIYKRSFGKEADKTASYVKTLITTMNEDNMVSSIKHFPGYGDNIDTHTGIATDKRDIETFRNIDFLPFIAGIEVGAPTILVNHNIIECMDPEKPATLSENVHNILRDELKFTGIIITDDLAMNAVKSYVENGEAAIQAVIAGNDMIISSDFVKQEQEIINAVNDGRIPIEKIDTAVKRIIAFKYTYGILQ